jgi:hypothetical protein
VEVFSYLGRDCERQRISYWGSSGNRYNHGYLGGNQRLGHAQSKARRPHFDFRHSSNGFDRCW